MTDQKSVFNWQFFFGFILVLTGGLLLADRILEIQILRDYWPLLIVFVGIIFFAGMIMAKKRGAWLAIPGALITIGGVILYIHNAYNLWWTWTYAWGLLISAIGIGMLIMNIYLKREGLRKAAGWIIGIGLVLFVLFGIFFEVVLDLAGLSINSGIFLGSGLVLLGLYVVFSRFIFSTTYKKDVLEEISPEPITTGGEKVSEGAEVMTSDVDETGEVEKRRSLTPLDPGIEFSQLVFDVAGEVFIEQGDECTLRIEGDQEHLSKIVTNVTEETLSLTFQSSQETFKKLKWIGEESQVQYFVTLKSLSALTLSGAGNIHADQLFGENLSIHHSGEGRLIFDGLNYQKIQISFEGLGEISLQGEVQSQDVDLSGLGFYNAQDLKSQEANVNVSGAGTAKVWVEKNLNATLTGAGSIHYKGMPAVEKSITGLGNVKPLETD